VKLGRGWIELVLLTLPAFPQHRALLPQPVQLTYGEGKLSLNSLKINTGANASSEDRVAAGQLSACLNKGGERLLDIAHGDAPQPVFTLERTGAIDALPQTGEHPGPESRESYSIVVTEAGGRISARSSAGLFYGVQTVCQMVEGDGSLPEVKIEDWPAFAYRGTMVDMSEGPLPTADEVKRQLDFLARWKVNQYYFYSETSIELTGYPLLNAQGRFSQKEVRIVAYGRERHIDVIPCLELYGHLHDLFRLEKYSDLADFPHGGEFKAGDPKAMKLLADWQKQFVSLFPSPFVHIGFDETWDIQKAAQARGANSTAKDLFIRQFEDVSQLFHQSGKTVMAWADIMVKYPEIVSSLPAGTIAVAWYYDPEPDPQYKQWLDPLAQHRIPHFVAPGVNSWDEIAPDYPLTFANIDTMLAAGRTSKAIGVINTIWTDDGQMLMRSSLPGMAYGAVASWQTPPIAWKDFFTSYAQQMYPAAVADEVTQALEKQALSEVHLQRAIGHDTMNRLWDDPFTAEALKRTRAHKEDLHLSRIFAEESEEHIYRARELFGNKQDFGDLLFDSQLLDYAGMKFQYAAQILQQWDALGSHPTRDQLDGDFLGNVSSQQHGKIVDLMDSITALRRDYERQWQEEYQPYRLGSALGRWDAEYQYWLRLQVLLEEFGRGYRTGQSLPGFVSFLHKGG
jgi:hexosaminidase